MQLPGREGQHAVHDFLLKIGSPTSNSTRQAHTEAWNHAGASGSVGCCFLRQEPLNLDIIWHFQKYTVNRLKHADALNRTRARDTAPKQTYTINIHSLRPILFHDCTVFTLLSLALRAEGQPAGRKTTTPQSLSLCLSGGRRLCLPTSSPAADSFGRSVLAIFSGRVLHSSHSHSLPGSANPLALWSENRSRIGSPCSYWRMRRLTSRVRLSNPAIANTSRDVFAFLIFKPQDSDLCWARGHHEKNQPRYCSLGFSAVRDE